MPEAMPIASRPSREKMWWCFISTKVPHWCCTRARPGICCWLNPSSYGLSAADRQANPSWRWVRRKWKCPRTGVERHGERCAAEHRHHAWGLGDVVLKVIDVVGLKDRAQELVALKLAQQLDDRVNEGVYALQPERLTPLKGQTPVHTMEMAKPGAAVLVFVHGTFSTTCESGFANLWSRHPQLVASLFSHYNNLVYGLDHATLGKTPIENALTLVRACPRYPVAPDHPLPWWSGGRSVGPFSCPDTTG